MIPLLTGHINAQPPACDDYTIEIIPDNDIYIGQETTIQVKICREEDQEQQYYDNITIGLVYKFELTDAGDFTYDAGNNELTKENISLNGGSPSNPTCKTFEFSGIFKSGRLANICDESYTTDWTATSVHDDCEDLEDNESIIAELILIDGTGGGIQLTDAINNGLLPDFPGGKASFKLKGTLKINSNGPNNNGYTIGAPLGAQENKGKVLMDWASKIEVKDNKILNIHNEILTGCGVFWDGVYAGSNAEVHYDNVEIREAVYGLSVTGDADFTVEETDFRVCFIGIDINHDGQFPNSDHIRVIRGCHFRADQLPFPVPWPGYNLPKNVDETYAGIRVENLNDALHIGSKGSRNSRFYTLNNGLIKHRANVSIEDALFQDMNYNSNYGYLDPNGAGIHANNKYIRYIYVGYPPGYILVNKPMPHRLFARNNTFIDVFKGILGIAGNYEILNNNIGNAPSTIQYIGIDIRDQIYNSIIESNDIEDFTGLGIYLANSNGLHSLDIAENSVTGKKSGIFYGRHGVATLDMGKPLLESSIKDNVISSYGQYGLYVDNTHSVIVDDNEMLTDKRFQNAGMYVLNCDDSQIRNNYIEGGGYGTGGFKYYNTGLRIRHNTNTYFDNNAMDDVRDGLLVLDMSIANGLYCNTMKNMTHGIHYNSTGITGDQLNHGNRWDENSTRISYDALHEGTKQIFNNSRYTVPENSGIYTPDDQAIEPQNDWFYLQSIDPPDCPIAPSGPDRVTSLDSFIVLSEFDSLNYAEGLNWFANYQFLRKYSKHPGMLDTFEIGEAYYDSLRNTGLGTVFMIDSVFIHVLDDHVSMAQAASNAEDSIRQYLDQFIVAEDSLAARGFDNQSQEYSTYDATRDELNDWIQYADSLYEILDSIRHERFQEIYKENNQFSPSNSFESNMQTINEIRLAKVQGVSDTLSSSELEVLEELAGDCPMAGGKAVYHARTLLNAYTDTIRYWPDTTCMLTQQGIRQSIDRPSGQLKLYPNPAANQLSVLWKQPINPDATYTIQIVDVNGRMVQRLTGVDHSSQLNISNVPSGMYLIRMISENGKIRSAWFVK